LVLEVVKIRGEKRDHLRLRKLVDLVQLLLKQPEKRYGYAQRVGVRSRLNQPVQERPKSLQRSQPQALGRNRTVGHFRRVNQPLEETLRAAR
jgi:hypothetical protein